MYKKILSFLLAVLCIAGMTSIGVSATEENLIYFEAPESWSSSDRVFCHITNLKFDYPLAGYLNKKEQCTQVEGNLWSYDLSVVDGLEEGVEYSVVFIVENTREKTHELLLTSECIGDIAYTDGTIYNVPEFSKEYYAAYWENQNPTEIGPIKTLTSDGCIGTCIPESRDAKKIFEKFLTTNLTSARENSGKTDQELIDNAITELGITPYQVTKIIERSGMSVDWESSSEVIIEYDWKYTIKDGKITLVGCTLQEDIINIPDTIDGIPVTGIDSENFFKNMYFGNKVINIPAGLTDISLPVCNDFYSIAAINVHEDNPVYSSVDGVLYSKDKKTLISYPPEKSSTTHKNSNGSITSKPIESYTVADGVITLAEGAFFGCSFKEIILPETLKTISKDALARCNFLSKLTIPASVTNISGDAFLLNYSLTSVDVAPKSNTYTSKDGVLFSKDGTSLIYCPIANTRKQYTVAEDVTEIGTHAFQSCRNLKSITLPEGLETIGYGAFSGCPAALTIPANVSSIAAEAFSSSHGMTEVIIPNGIERIEYRTFRWGIYTTVSLPDGLTYIGPEAFSYSPIKDIVIPDTVTTIDDMAFSGCSSMDEITIPASVTEFGKDIFSYCSDKLTIYGYMNSAAETYAKQNHLRFFAIDREFQLGDTNLDGTINIKDATTIQKFLASLLTFDETAESVADYDGDGRINIKDATAIQKFLAGII